MPAREVCFLFSEVALRLQPRPSFDLTPPCRATFLASFTHLRLLSLPRNLGQYTRKEHLAVINDLKFSYQALTSSRVPFKYHGSRGKSPCR